MGKCTSPSQNPADLLNQNAKKAFASLIKMNAIALPGVITPTVAAILMRDSLAPEVMAGLGIVVIASTVLCTRELVNIGRLAKENNDIVANMPKGGFTAATVLPLSEELPPEKKALLLDVESNANGHLLAGGDSLESGLVADEVSEIEELARDRLNAIGFVSSRLLSPEVKSNSSNGPLERVAVLKQLDRIVAGPPDPLGLSLTEVELSMLINILSKGAVAELAPETITAYAKYLGHILESYINYLKLDSTGKAATDNMLEAAVRAEQLLGGLVSPPVGPWAEAKRREALEKSRVVITEDEAVMIAKSFTAIKHTAIPEARPAIQRTTDLLGELLEEGIKTQNGVKQSSLKDIDRILSINLDRIIGKENLEKLDVLIHGFGGMTEAQSFGSPFENLKTAKSILRAFEKTDFGSVSIDGDTIVVDAENIAMADILACTIAVLCPHVTSLRVITGDGMVQVTMDAFYRARLMRRDRGYLGRIFSSMFTSEPPQVTIVPALQTSTS